MVIGFISDVYLKKWQKDLVQYKGQGLPLSWPEPHSDQQWLQPAPIWHRPALTTEWGHGNLISSLKTAFSSIMLSNLGRMLRGDIKIPHSRMTKTCWETLVTCLWNICDNASHKKPFVLSVFGIGLLWCIDTGPSQFCETSVKVTNWVTNPFRWFCDG